MSFDYKRVAAYSLILTTLLVVCFAVRVPLVQYATDAVMFVKEYSDAHENILEEVRQEIVNPPVRGYFAGETTSLSPAEIVRLTNLERAKKGLLLLKENNLLTLSAQHKLQDMFDRQYFEHVSPDGKGPGYLADQVEYSYVVVGENLALGSFKDDAALVAAWMESLGHRENILNERYLEIGVAVGRGVFKGERVWLAVQEFGKPTAACPVINQTLKDQIEKNKATVAKLGADIGARRRELDTMPHASAEESAAYNAKVSEYNGLVSRYNKTLATLRKEIDEYNQTVKDFNSCAEL